MTLTKTKSGTNKKGQNIFQRTKNKKINLENRYTVLLWEVCNCH